MGHLLSYINISNIGQKQVDAADAFLFLQKMKEGERKDETKKRGCLGGSVS